MDEDSSTRRSLLVVAAAAVVTAGGFGLYTAVGPGGATGPPTAPAAPPAVPTALTGAEAARCRAATERAALERALEPTFRRARSLPSLTSLVVVRCGEVVREAYAHGLDADDPVNVKSVSKTLLSGLVGAAIHRGILPGLDARLVDLLPEAREVQDDPRIREVSVGDLLAMQAGLETTSFHNYGAWVSSRDWIRDALRRPFECDPGECRVYSTGSYHLLSAILTRASGRDTRTLFRELLLGPLGIPVRSWDRGPDGVYLGGNNMSLTPRELARFGRLYLDGGVAAGDTLLPPWWIRASWRPYGRSRWSGDGYGFGWWRRSRDGTAIQYAFGYGGQFLFVVPELRAVVVATSLPGRRRRGGGSSGEVRRLVTRDVLPALREAAPGAAVYDGGERIGESRTSKRGR